LFVRGQKNTDEKISFKWENIKENILRYKEYHQLYFQELNHNSSKKDEQRGQVNIPI
jgi:hypothetical protein